MDAARAGRGSRRDHLGAALIATALSNVDNRSDLTTLGAGGGSFYDAGSPARMHLVVPWLPLVVTLIVVPALAMLSAGQFTRSRLPSERPAG